VGGALLLAAALLCALLVAVQSTELQGWYAYYQAQLSQLEYSIVELRNVWIILLIVLLLYAVKSLLPLFPVSLMCVITAAVLPMYLCFAVNIVGIMIWISIKYLDGKQRGGGSLRKLLALNNDVQSLFERDGKGNPWLLFLFRVVPTFPVNSVSKIYGAMGFDYFDFVLISLLGFLPKLISYIFIGSNAFNPLSTAFLVPSIIIFALSGILMLGINHGLSNSQKKEYPSD
jgi:uncharacterized membrane protein YdjX (TVP38/TMEM64 family)